MISVRVEGRIAHKGSLEHGRGMNDTDNQVQRAGGEEFSHNEINHDAATLGRKSGNMKIDTRG